MLRYYAMMEYMFFLTLINLVSFHFLFEFVRMCVLDECPCWKLGVKNGNGCVNWFRTRLIRLEVRKHDSSTRWWDNLWGAENAESHNSASAALGSLGTRDAILPVPPFFLVNDVRITLGRRSVVSLLGGWVYSSGNSPNLWTCLTHPGSRNDSEWGGPWADRRINRPMNDSCLSPRPLSVASDFENGV